MSTSTGPHHHPHSAYERDYLNWYHGDPLKRSLVQAHTHSINHGEELKRSARCGCFHFGARFRPEAITVWVRDSRDRTAFCPEIGRAHV